MIDFMQGRLVIWFVSLCVMLAPLAGMASVYALPDAAALAALAKTVATPQDQHRGLQEAAMPEAPVAASDCPDHAAMPEGANCASGIHGCCLGFAPVLPPAAQPMSVRASGQSIQSLTPPPWPSHQPEGIFRPPRRHA